MKINGNKLAQAIALDEGKKVQVNVAQIKEILRIVREHLGRHKGSEVLAWVEPK